MQPKEIYDVMVIGGGPAGMSASLYALRDDKKVLLLEKESIGGQIATSPRVENFPTKETISGAELADEMFTQVMNLGVHFELDTITEVRKEGDLFALAGTYGTYYGKTVIIATGVKSLKLNVPGEEELSGKGVSYCATCDGPFFKGQDTAVIGDANSALQYALLLSSYCPNVTLLTLTDKLFGERMLIEKVKATPNIKILSNVQTTAFIGNNDLEKIAYKDLKTGEIKELPVKGAFVAIGKKAQNEIFENFVNLEKGYILTDDNMQTKTPGMYAAGDCRLKAVKQAITACNDGAIAAINAIKYLALHS